MKIIFLDIDGVILPGRALYMPGQVYTPDGAPLRFDPSSVGLVNKLCEDLPARIVVHSNWRRNYHGWAGSTLCEQESLIAYMISQGLRGEYFHEDWQCPMKMSSSRWYDISMWMDDHPEVKDEDIVILEDEEMPSTYGQWGRMVVRTDFDEGLTVEQFMGIRQRFGLSRLLLACGL